MVRTSFAAVLLVFAGVFTLALRAQNPSPVLDGPDLRDGRLAFPSQYREWVFLSAGLGMNYGPNAPAPGQPQSFTNVYVNPASYRAFMQSGAWPDRTLFVLEIRNAASEGSINHSGHYQTDLVAIEANVKDARLPGGWGFSTSAASKAAWLRCRRQPRATRATRPTARSNTRSSSSILR